MARATYYENKMVLDLGPKDRDTNEIAVERQWTHREINYLKKTQTIVPKHK